MSDQATYKLAVLVSGSGSNLQALLDDQQGYRVELVLADRTAAYGLQRGLEAGVATVALPLRRPRDVDERSGSATVATPASRPRCSPNAAVRSASTNSTR